MIKSSIPTSCNRSVGLSSSIPCLIASACGEIIIGLVTLRRVQQLKKMWGVKVIITACGEIIIGLVSLGLVQKKCGVFFFLGHHQHPFVFNHLPIFKLGLTQQHEHFEKWSHHLL